MEGPDKIITARKIVKLCDSYPRAVDIITSLGRAMWELSFISTIPNKDVLWPEGTYSRIDKHQLFSMLPAHQDIAAIILDQLEEKELCKYLQDGRISFNLNVFQPFFLTRTLLSGVRPDNDLRYFVMRNIRKHYNCGLSSRTAHLFQVLADAINSFRVEKKNPRKPQRPKYIWNYNKELLPYLKSVLEEDIWSESKSEENVKLFIESCREVGYLLPYYKSGCIDFRTATIDAAYLLSNIFGIPTRMRGFDELFGGGGLMLAEHLNEVSKDELGARAVLIMGRFGTGKSLLSLQLSVEVARKGGLAWIMPLEQSAQECLYMLETMGALRNDQSMVIATDVLTASKILEGKEGDRGALIILKTIKDSFGDFLDALRENASRMDAYPLRLISVDPINSVQRDTTKPAELRSQTLKAIEEIKRAGTNVLLVAEGDTDPTHELLFEQNIADTVIQLSVDKQHGYAARSFEVKKSRLQREQRGKHPFSIVPGAGLRVYPSTAAVSARTQPRGMTGHKDVIRYGMPALDDILGQGAITAGDILVFQGSGGSFKTPLGLIFLLSSDLKSGRRNQLPLRSLLISARDDEASIRYMLGQEFVHNHINSSIQSGLELASTHKTIEDINICSLPHGHVHPGYILQRIEDEINEARLNGYWIDRVMLDNIAHWEMSSPFISEDETFGDTLVGFLRRHRVSSLLICGQVTPNSTSVVQRSIIDGADCLIQFDRIDFRGTHRVMLQVLKTRGMRHRGESFEVILGPKTLDIKPTSSLLRIVGGETRPVNIRLFLNSKSELRKEYNSRLVEAIKSVLSHNTKIEQQDRMYQSRVLGLGKLSAIDELQVLQLDEFQLPKLSEENSPNFILYKFPLSYWDEKEWGDFLPFLRERVRFSDESFFAVPFYENVSLLAYQHDIIKEQDKTSWQLLVEKCEQWEAEHPDPGDIFFDFPKSSVENYNCLFLEILFQLLGTDLPGEDLQLPQLLSNPSTLEACKLYRRLCRRAYLATDESEIIVRQMQGIVEPVKVVNNAVVWRHWYTTLNQMFNKLGPRERDKIQVSPLPGNVTIAGEWYCGVTSYSAAPDVGIEVIKMLTSHEAELDRLQAGIGLPTRSKFYEGKLGRNITDTSVSPYFSMDLNSLKKIIYKALRRSNIGLYSQFSNILAHHLQRIIAIPDGDEEKIEDKISSAIDSLNTRIEFVLSDQT